LADLNAQRINLSIQLMQALGGGFAGKGPAQDPAPTPSTASLTQ
jgi:hypothetical protein